jgi:hypothetical protein
LTGVTLLVLLVLVGMGGYYGYRALFAPVDESVTASPKDGGCQELTKGEVVRPRDVTVTVLNAGSRTGLAGQVQQQLVRRGFHAGNIDNAPEGTGVRFVRVRAASVKDPAARLVAAQFGKGTLLVHSKEDLGPGVDVIVGDRYKGLEKHAPRKLRATVAGSGC